MKSGALEEEPYSDTEVQTHAEVLRMKAEEKKALGSSNSPSGDAKLVISDCFFNGGDDAIRLRLTKPLRSRKKVAPSTHGVGKIEHGMGLPVIDEGSELDSKVNQEEVITGITLTKKAEEVRAPGALVDFPNVAEVAPSTHGVGKIEHGMGLPDRC